MTRARGAALVLVLWLVALLAALVGTFALTARVEALQGKVLAGGVASQEVARAGLEYALAQTMGADPSTRWVPDGRAHAWEFGGYRVEIGVVDETGKVDINQADVPLLSGLLRAVAVEPRQAEQLAAAIIDWRDPDALLQPTGGAEDSEYAAAGRAYGAKDAPFETLAELQQVLGMTPDLYARLFPYITVHSGRAVPDPAYAPTAVLTAMELDVSQVLAWREAAEAGARAGSGTYGVRSVAVRDDGREAALHAVVRNGGRNIPGSAYTVLQWQEGVSLR